VSKVLRFKVFWQGKISYTRGQFDEVCSLPGDRNCKDAQSGDAGGALILVLEKA